MVEKRGQYREGDDSSLKEEELLTKFMCIANQYSSSMPRKTYQTNIDEDLSQLFRRDCNSNYEIGYENSGRLATVGDFASVIRHCLISAMHWINELFQLAGLDTDSDKVAIIQNVVLQYSIFTHAAWTAKKTVEEDVLLLCNRTIVNREMPAYLQDYNISTKMVVSVLDELVASLRKLCLSHEEISLLSAITVLDIGVIADADPSTLIKLSSLRDRALSLLGDQILEAYGAEKFASRYADMLLILPTVTKLSMQIRSATRLDEIFEKTEVKKTLLSLFKNIHLSFDA